MTSGSREFFCPACKGRIATEFDQAMREMQAKPKLSIEYWSDGRIISNAMNPVGSIAVCPLCSAIFPNYFTEDYSDAFYRGETFDRPGAVGILKKQDNSQHQAKQEAHVMAPTFKTWRMMTVDFHQDDPIMWAMIYESFLQVNNDRLRKAAKTNRDGFTNLFTEMGTPSLVKLFVARVKNEMIHPDSHSHVFDATVEDFFGAYRLYFLAAELARSMRKFDWAEQILEKLRLRLRVFGPLAEDMWEFPAEAERLNFPAAVWQAKATQQRLDALTHAVAIHDSSLILVNSGEGQLP